MSVLERVVFRAAVAISAGLLLWMARPLFTGRIPFTGDLLHSHYPLRAFYADALASGRSFDWMPSLFGGFYVVGEGQLGGYHPFHLLLYRLLPLDTAFMIEILAAYPLLFAGMWLFLRPVCGPGAAAFGAMLSTFSGFMLSHGVHPNMVTVVAHAPWLLVLIRRASAATTIRQRVRAAGLIALLTGSQILLGHPQSVWFSVLIEVAYAAYVGIAGPAPSRVAMLTTWMAGRLLGTAVGAVQLFATLHALGRSTRAAADATFATTYSLPPLYLLQLLHPYGLWERVLRWNERAPAQDEFAAYGGAVALVLATWAIASRWRDASRGVAESRRFALCVAAFGAFGIWMALGSYGGLFYAQTWLPFVAQFRVPARYVLLAHLALATVAAIALGRLLHEPQPGAVRGRAGLTAAWVLALMAIGTAVFLLRRTEANLSSGQTIAAFATGPLLFVTAAALLTLAMRGARWAVVALVLLAGVDQAVYGLGGIVGWRDYIDRRDVPQLLDVDEVPAHTGRMMHGGFPNLYLLEGYEALDGYVGLEPAKLLDYRSPNALRVAGVRYIHAEWQNESNIEAEPLARGWFRLSEPSARVRLVSRARPSVNPAADIQAIDVDVEAVTTRELPLEGGPSGTARIARDEAGDLVVQTTSATRQLLILTESFDEGWIARVDEGPAAVERVNGDFLGCVVPAGDHRVALEFRPLHLRVGKGISLSAAIVALLLAGGFPRRRARP